MFEDYYEILGIDSQAGQEEIKKAYRDLAKKYHPDANIKGRNTEEIFKRISMAYNTLADPEKKSIYDAKREYYLFRELTNPNATPPPEAPRPHYASVYETKKREYTPMAWMYGKIVIFVIITLAFLIPYGIYHYSSVYHYETGLELEEQGEYTEAYNSYLKALSRWGARNFEASYRAGLILLNRGASREAIPYFQRCYDYTNSDSVETWLKFKLAHAYSNIGQYNNALDEIKNMDQNGFLSDSSILLAAEIKMFRARKFAEGILDYQVLIDRGIELKQSWFGIGWGHQNLFRYPEAITAFSECLKEDPNYAIALFYRGSAYYYSSDSIRACSDFLQAKDLGYPSADYAFRRSCEDSLKSFVPPMISSD